MERLLNAGQFFAGLVIAILGIGYAIDSGWPGYVVIALAVFVVIASLRAEFAITDLQQTIATWRQHSQRLARENLELKEKLKGYESNWMDDDLGINPDDLSEPMNEVAAEDGSRPSTFGLQGKPW